MTDARVPSDAGELAPGMVIAGQYELVRLLGRGGMGVVWAARQLTTGTTYALKFLRGSREGAQDPGAVKRFLREARAAAMVRHPHVVFTADVLEPPGGWPVIVMELLAGESLRARLGRSPPLSLEETARILLPVVSAVGIAHQHGIVHRDLKPDNIFLSRDPGGVAKVKVLDFGIAKMTRSDEQLTQMMGSGAGTVLGTPNYMSPEQVFGEQDIDQRADIWALGVILYECIAGTVPTKAANVGQVFKRIVAGGIKPLGEAAPGTPPDVTALVDRMLAQARDARPFDLREVARVLRRYSSIEVPGFGPPQILPDPVSAPVALPPAAPAPAAEEPPSTGKSWSFSVLALGAVTVAILVGESLLLWRRPPAAPVPAPPARATSEKPDAEALPP